MTTDKLRSLLAVAALGMSAGGPAINSNYTERRDKQRAEQAKALEKRQRVREEIRERRARAISVGKAMQSFLNKEQS
jgi:hypothetical protein